MTIRKGWLVTLLLVAAIVLTLDVLVLAIDGTSTSYECQPSELAKVALQPGQNVSIMHIPEIGYSFLPTNVTAKRGLLFMPEDDVDPAAYAPFARAVAEHGYYGAILDKAEPGHATKAMMLHPKLQHWTVMGHGSGGAVAAHFAVALNPRVKALALAASPLPADVDLKPLNMLLLVVYGKADSVVTPGNITDSFSRMAGDTRVKRFPLLGHYDFASSSNCVGNTKGKRRSVQNKRVVKRIASLYVRAVNFSHWPGASEKALSYGDNVRLTPGLNISKPYPLGDEIRVNFTEVPIPGTNPQRLWWVFTPTQIEGGLVYYPGGAVDGRAYFPLAFEIAARGHLVVIVQQPMREAMRHFFDAHTVLKSNNPVFAGVPSGKWAVGGHSLGGVGSSLYASLNRSGVYANVLHAGGWARNFTQSDLPVVQIYGTLDNVSAGGYESYRYWYTDPPPKGRYGPRVNLETSKFVVFEGGNHYQIGDYGYQAPDEIPIRSLEEQHVFFANETVSFLKTCKPQEGVLSATY